MIANKFLEVQNELNMKLSPEWATKGWAYTDAMFTEATEMYNHLNWEWWRATDRVIDWDQVKLELVDVGHFLFSEVIAQGQEELFTSIVEKCKELPEPPDSKDIGNVKSLIKLFIETVLRYDGIKESEDIDWVFKTEDFGNSIVYFFTIMHELGLKIEEFYTLFIGKVCLNQLRWKNGYKKGIYGNTHSALSVEETKQYYIKTWDGVEDNVWLAEFARTLNPQSPDFKEQLFAGLEARYKEVYDKVWATPVVV